MNKARFQYIGFLAKKFLIWDQGLIFLAKIQGNMIIHSKKQSFLHGYGYISDFWPHLSKNTIFQKAHKWN